MSPDHNYFADFPNRYWVETGTYRGDAIQLAKDGGFQFIRSMDIDPANAQFCVNRFDLKRRPSPYLKLFTGDSAEDLWSMIADICEPITFWLDSHTQLFEGELEHGNPFPLLKELEQIAMHPIKGHTILIDDLLMMTHPDTTGWALNDIKAALWRINPTYQFNLVANPVKNNLLIAYVKA
jgi:hypothetical protein